MVLHRDWLSQTWLPLGAVLFLLNLAGWARNGKAALELGRSKHGAIEIVYDRGGTVSSAKLQGQRGQQKHRLYYPDLK